METKTFRAPTMLEALRLVQTELGPEAMVVSMRELGSGPAWQLWRKPCCEIVAASPARRPAAARPVPTRAGAEVRTQRLVIPSTGANPATNPEKQEDPEGDNMLSSRKDAMLAINGSSPVSAPGAKKTRPFNPQVVSTNHGSSSTTRTWVVGDSKIQEKPAETLAISKAQTDKTRADETELSTPLLKLSQLLIRQGLDVTLVERLKQACCESLSPSRLADTTYLTNYIKQQIQANLKPAPRRLSEGRKIICLVGSSGAGKTSACARLAVEFAQQGKRVAWIEANTIRAGAISEARLITDSFGVPLHVVYTPNDMVKALAQTKDADIVLVDTPGCNPRREASLVELGSIITSIPSRMTLLVSPATTKETDMKYALAAFRPFRIDGLVVTKMDEAMTYGNIYNLTYQNKVPILYFTTGPAIMDGLVPGDGETLVNAMINEGI
jgi:flagellar biosynthesis protein FlhF